MLRSLLWFGLHQFVGTLGTAFLAAFALVSLAETGQILHLSSSARWAYWILTETPYYPVQIALAFYLGWVIWKRFPTRSARYVWVLPLLLLVFAVTTRITLSPRSTSVLLLPRNEPSHFSHWFGWGCRPAAHCLDQLVLTLPLYVSLSYSVGAQTAWRRAMRHPSGQSS